MEKSKSVLFYTDWARPLQGLPLEDVGRLFYAILNYTETGNPQTFDSPAAAMAWEFIRLRLDNNLENKYGVAPVHTCGELELLAGRFPENIKLYMAYLGEEALGGTVTYINKQTVHTQYISASPKGKSLGALDLLFSELINNVFTDYTYFDFGKSTEREGTYLNENLIFQKEGFGGRGVCYDTYEWEP